MTWVKDVKDIIRDTIQNRRRQDSKSAVKSGVARRKRGRPIKVDSQRKRLKVSRESDPSLDEDEKENEDGDADDDDENWFV